MCHPSCSCYSASHCLRCLCGKKWAVPLVKVHLLRIQWDSLKIFACFTDYLYSLATYACLYKSVRRRTIWNADRRRQPARQKAIHYHIIILLIPSITQLWTGVLTCSIPFAASSFFQSTACILIRSGRVPGAVCMSCWLLHRWQAEWLASDLEMWNEPTGGCSLAWAVVRQFRTFGGRGGGQKGEGKTKRGNKGAREKEIKR